MRAKHRDALDRERLAVLQQLDRWLEIPMTALGLAWLALTAIELAGGANARLNAAAAAIWGIFAIEFAVRFALAPRKVRYLRKNLLTLASLLLPAARGLRVFRAFRIFARARGVRVFRLVASMNRGMRALSAVMGRRGLGYMFALTVMVTFAGSAGMYAFERNPGGAGLNDYGAALWWTAMTMTTMGSEYWPRTAEGRMLCLVLAVYAFAVFGYLTAALASYFIARDAAAPKAEVAGASDLRKLRDEIGRMRADLRALGYAAREGEARQQEPR